MRTTIITTIITTKKNRTSNKIKIYFTTGNEIDMKFFMYTPGDSKTYSQGTEPLQR